MTSRKTIINAICCTSECTADVCCRGQKCHAGSVSAA